MGSSSVSGRWGTLVFVGALAVGAFLIGNALSGVDILRRGEKYSEVGQPVVNRVRDIAALTTVEVVESATIEKGNDFGWLNWVRGDRVFMFVVAKIGAGIDFERFYTESFEVDKESGTVTVRMPPAHITYVAIDNSQTRVIDRSTGVFTTGDPKLETDARQVAEKVLRNAAIDAGILERAEKNARTLIEGLLLELGYTRVLFTPLSVTTLSYAMPRIALLIYAKRFERQPPDVGANRPRFVRHSKHFLTVQRPTPYASNKRLELPQRGLILSSCA